MPPIRLQLICDHQVLVDALADRLAHESEGFSINHRRSGDDDLAAALRNVRPDVVVIDAWSVGGAWPKLVDLVTDTSPRTPVAVLSGTGEPDEAVLAARRCVSAWLPPHVTADHVLEVLRRVVDGHTIYPSAVLGIVLRHLAGRTQDPGAPHPLATLTERERDVLACLVAGRSGKEIADNLDMATNTVRTHTNRIFRKLGVHSRLEAVHLARRCHFDDDVPGGAPQRDAVHLVAPWPDSTGPRPQSEYDA